MAGVTIDTPQARPPRLLHYSLGRADAFAYASLKREQSGWAKVRTLVLVSAAGITAGMLPATLTPLQWWACALALALCAGTISFLWAKLDVRTRAARIDVPPGEIVLELAPGHLVQRSGDSVRRVAFDEIAQVIDTSDHVFVRADTAPIIIPARAFASGADKASFAKSIDVASEQAQS